MTVADDIATVKSILEWVFPVYFFQLFCMFISVHDKMLVNSPKILKVGFLKTKH